MDKIEQPYAVVLFMNETRKGKKVIDLVPKSWLVQVNDKNWKCFYPPNDSNVATFVKEQKAPNPSWKKYEVEVVKRADMYAYINTLKIAQWKSILDLNYNKKNPL